MPEELLLVHKMDERDGTYSRRTVSAATTAAITVKLHACHFSECHFRDFALSDSYLAQSHFVNCTFSNCEFRGQATTLAGTTFASCKFVDVRLLDCNVAETTFRGCFFTTSRINFCRETARFTHLAIDTSTTIVGLILSRDHQDIESFRLLQRNIRISRWNSWYADHPIQQWFARAFWLLSDYGTSTRRLALSVLVVTLFFQQAYLLPSYLGYSPLIGCAGNDGHALTDEDSRWGMLQLKSLYFSIVTSMTVGYGDITPLPSSTIAHVVVLLQITTSYILLGALLARVSTVIQD